MAHLPHHAYATSGRAAIHAAIRQLELPLGSIVLVSTYHCPTMVAPILRAGMLPAFFPIRPDGQPALDRIDPFIARQARAMCVAHYFGLPSSLRDVREWCDERAIALIEDCAHSYFGQAGERPVGRWGDYATASLTKFFPVAEGGLLASAHRPLKPMGLAAPGGREQLKGILDVLEFAHIHGRMSGLNHLLSPFYALKNLRRHDKRVRANDQLQVDNQQPVTTGIECDLARIEQSPTCAAIALYSRLPRQRLVGQRRKNFSGLLAALSGLPGASSLVDVLPEDAAPYALPLQIDGSDRADEIYARLREANLPIFRWDQVWPGTPASNDDAGPRWNREVLQMLCHQSLNDRDIQVIGEITTKVVQAI